MNSIKRPYRFLLPGSLALVFALIIVASFSSHVWATPSQSPAGGTVPTPTATPLPTVIPTPTNTPVVTVVPTTQITPVPTPTAPPGETPIPVAIVVVQPDQTTTVDATEETEADVRVEVPVNTFTETRQMAVRDVAVEDLPAPAPPQVQEVRRAFEVSVYTVEGSQEEHPALGRCITITVPYTDGDVAAAGGRTSDLVLMRYDSAVQAWIILTTRVNVVARTLSAQVCTTLSTFSVGVLVPPPTATPTVSVTPTDAEATATAMALLTPTVPPTATAVPPKPGDVSPSSNLLVGLMLAGIILAISGAFYLHNTSRGEES